MFRIGLIVATAALIAGLPAAAAAQEPAGLPPQLRQFRVVEQDGRKLIVVSLQALLSLAIQRNTALDAVRVNEQVAMSALTAARHRLNPTLTTDFGYDRTITRSPFITDSFANLTGTDALTFSSSLDQQLGSGISYGLTYAERRARSQGLVIPSEGGDPQAGTNSDWVDSAAVTGSLSIPIGQDYGREFNDLPVRRGEVGLTQSRLGIRQQELQILQLVASTYWDVVGALENVQVQQEAVRLSERLLADNRERLQAGVLSPTDVQVTETQLAREQQSLLSARLTVLRIEDQVRALLSLESLGQEYGLKPEDQPSVRSVEFQFPQLLSEVYASDPNLRQLEAQVAANALDLEEARNQEKPNVDLDLFYTLNGYSSDPLSGVQGFSQPKTHGYGAAITWTVPLFDRTTPERVRQRRLEGEQLQLQVSSRKSDLSVRLQSLLRQLRLAQEEVQTARQAESLAEEQLNNEIERFRLGQSTSFRVSQAQQDAAQARVQVILARIRFEQNYNDLLVLTGRIYQTYGLESSVEASGPPPVGSP